MFFAQSAFATLALALATVPMPSTTCCPIIELRQYTLAAGKFDTFIDLFDSHFVDTQEADGITLIGQFKVLDDPNRFFWLRGFPSMTARADSLSAFYFGPVWKEYRSVANPMLVENDNVLLLHPAHEGSGFPATEPSARPPVGTTTYPPGLVVATIYSLATSNGPDFDKIFEESVRPVITDAGARVIATLSTEHSPNNFPKLRIRDDANVFVLLSCFADQAAYDRYQTAVAADPRWAKVRETFALLRMYSPPEVWRLAASPRSALHC